MNKTLKIIFLLLMIPVIGFAQKKKELKQRIVQKNDSITVFINQIYQLNNKLETLENENVAFEGDIRKLLKKVSDEQGKNEGLNHNLNNQDTEIKALSSSNMKLTNELDSFILKNSDYQQEIKDINEQLNFKLLEGDDCVMYFPAVFHSFENIEDAGGEYDITFSLQAEDCFCDNQTFISFGAGSDLIEGKVYMFGLTYDFSDAGYLYNFVADVRKLTKYELDAGYADPTSY
ncbi:MAG: hypothetical protein ACKVJA_00325 [Flavobacteriales bacterium]